MAAGLTFVLVHRALIDDAYITLSYARNLAFRLHWGLIPQEPANSATSPLNVLLLAAGTAVLGGPVKALGAVYVGANVALAWWVGRVVRAVRLPVVGAVLAVAVVLFNPFVLSATGMETALAGALLAGLLSCAVRDRPLAFGLMAGLAVLTRLDLIIFVVLLGLSTTAVRERLARVAAAGAAVSGPWFVWSWLHFGSAIPDTFVIKTLQRSFGPWTFSNGPLLYLGRDAPATVLSFAPASLGCGVLLIWAAMRLTGRGDPRLDPVAALGVGAVAYYGAYSLLGVPAYQWYYGPVMAGSSLCAALLLGAAVGAVPARPACRGAGVAGQVLLGVMALAQVAVVIAHDLPWRREPIIFGNWATAADYARVGTQLGHRIGDATVTSPPEIGTLAFFCDCAIVDPFSDRGRIVPLVERRVAHASPVVRFLLRVNFWHLDRDLQPRPVDYDLVWEPGSATGPDAWQVQSSATGVGHLRLISR